MLEDVKTKLHTLIDSVGDETLLQMITDDIVYYTGNKDILDELDEEQLKELDEAIEEVDKGDTIDWDDFKKEMNEWKKR